MHSLRNSWKIPQRTFSTFKSAISLDTIYPNSSLKLTTPSKAAFETKDKFVGYIPMDKLDITYSRSSGPGGQNVNKVNTKVEVKFHVASATWLTDKIKQNWEQKHKNKLTKEGFAIFRSDLTRYQQMNLADCLEKIRTVARSCEQHEVKPSPETAEKHRRRLEKAAIERLAIKRYQTQLKRDREVPEIL